MPVGQSFIPTLLSALLLNFSSIAQANICTSYAQSSVDQHEKNILNLCGYRGSQWSNNYQRWYKECQSMSDKDVRHRLNMRDQLLAKCPEFKYPSVGRNRQSKLLYALLQATEKQDIRLVESLIAEGVNLAVQPKWLGASPLFVATMKSNFTLAKLLIANGAKPYLQTKGEENLLSLLLKRQYTNYSFLELFLRNKANPNFAAADKKTEFPLVIAAAKGDFRAVALLLKYKANPNLYLNRSALQLAVEQDHYPIVRALIKAGANSNLGIDGKVCNGKMALDLAFRNAKDRIIDLLLDNRALSSHECKKLTEPK